IRTYSHPLRKSFRIRTYEKQGVGDYAKRPSSDLDRDAPPCLDLPNLRCETRYTRVNPMTTLQNQVVTLGVTGASGALLAQKALDLLERDPRVAHIHLVVTETGQRLFAEELSIASGDTKQLAARILGRAATKIEVLPNKDVGASIASGSYEVDSMIVI